MMSLLRELSAEEALNPTKIPPYVLTHPMSTERLTNLEAVLGRHPAVHQASVVPVADEERGQIPVAFVVLRPGAHAGEAELKQFALGNAPPVQHPRRVFFKPELPLTGTSKIDRRALAEEAAGLIGRE